MSGQIVCLTGGIGGAKLALGLYRALSPGALTLGINTGDDFRHLGLEIWPDFDTALYTLAGLSDPVRGWGRVDETWAFMDAMRALGGADWFQLGDRDLATHVLRTEALGAGRSASEIAAQLSRACGLTARLLPVTQDPVRTVVETADGELSFQAYFVRHRAEPAITGLRYEGAAAATATPALLEALAAPDLAGVVIAPSNPLLSVGPILAITPLRQALAACRAPVVAVSPIVAGAAIKGPTARNMSDLGLDVSPVAVARLYADVLDGFLLDAQDAALAQQIVDLGLACHVAPTVMTGDAEKVALAREVTGFLQRLETRPEVVDG